ncbi:glutamine synthetase/guanido kinase [Russula earlei]|uniref:Glutamine synthetase/guanido kinase n=1 Tax=Russula earlei TaxID=71964 RepID=A0ACC0U009_9AGAM|nr:glutamine synthetase/guanido kinase [Russula earlei]
MATTSASQVAFGLQYRPASVELPTSGQGDVLNFLQSCGVGYIRLQWVDYTNITRYRVIPLSAFRDLMSAPRPGIGLTKATLAIVGASIAPGFSATGEYLYVPDLSSARHCGYARKLPTPENAGREDALKVPLCPRGLLRDIVSDVSKGKELGVEFLVGVETEFILLKSTELIVPVNDAPWSASRALLSGSLAEKCLEEIAESLRVGEIELLMYHSEAAPGQYEIVTGPLPPLEAADAVVFTRETIVNVAAKHGLHATFSPRVYTNNCGTAAHAHISVHPTARPPARPPAPNPNTNKSTTMTPLERSFLQSLVRNLPSSAAFTLPTAASYDRVRDGIWSCGTYACWGRDNREAAVRLTGPPGAHHFEVRTIDGTANPHIAFATLIGMGLVGIEKGLELKIEEVEGSAVDLRAEEREKRGVVGRLPSTLSAARHAARIDSTINDVLGKEFVRGYLSVNEAMENFLKGSTPRKKN